ncbi:hypothetical protein JCM6882_003043 [Rhodosporidiobolus microsporus]
MLFSFLPLALLALAHATPLPLPLSRRQFPSSFCNASSLSPPSVGGGTASAGFELQEGQQVVAVALARGTQNYTCTFSQQVESGVLALLYDVTCLAVALPSNTSASVNASSSSASSSEPAIAVPTATDSTASITDSATTLLAFPIDGTPTLSGAIAQASTSLPSDGLPPLPPPLPVPLSAFNLTSLPSIAVQIPFPFNASSFPYLGGGGVLGEWYFVTATSGEAQGENVPFFALPPYGTVTAREANRTAAPSEEGEGGGGDNATTSDLAWTAYEAVDGGNGMFATAVWSVNTAGGGLASQNCTGEGNTTSVDFASLLYFFR